jgi:hypothetical protein
MIIERGIKWLNIYLMIKYKLPIMLVIYGGE